METEAYKFVKAVAPEPANGNGSMVWRWLCGILCSILFTGLSAWFAFGRENVTQAQLEKYEETASLYARERGQLKGDLGTIKEAMQGMILEIKFLSAEAVKSSTKIDLLVTEAKARANK